MQEDEKSPIEMLKMLMDNANLISLNAKIDLESNLISVKFSVLCDENAIVENKTFKEILTSGFSENEIEHLKEEYEAYGDQNKSGISLSSENHDGIS